MEIVRTTTEKYQITKISGDALNEKMVELSELIRSNFDRPPVFYLENVKNEYLPTNRNIEYKFEGSIKRIRYLVSIEKPFPSLKGQKYNVSIRLPKGKRDEMTTLVESKFKEYEQELEKIINQL